MYAKSTSCKKSRIREKHVEVLQTLPLPCAQQSHPDSRVLAPILQHYRGSERRTDEPRPRRQLWSVFFQTSTFPRAKASLCSPQLHQTDRASKIKVQYAKSASTLRPLDHHEVKEKNKRENASSALSVSLPSRNWTGKTRDTEASFLSTCPEQLCLR